ncbi:YadA-like family protein [Thioclava sp. DLFJ4-1]|uniref:YadA-like family protein n=1 Tax=Thioclava sp. DLFJ4-1 TaxID=1915313 RepID=UPI000997269E|nr:YadA-like family protein [Thioclava sp. DLFJ4-1]OOY14484.1 hypothetical protein BMI85_20485 [Thioclava sp. DLFJ4-1]
MIGLVAQAAIFAASAAPAAQVYSGDLVVLGNACVGLDCAPSAPSEALVLSENNTRIAFGSTDGMRMTANQSSNGSLSGFFFDASQSGTYSDGPVEVTGYALNGTVEADGRLKIAAADFATLAPRSAYAPAGTDTTLTSDSNPLDGNAYIYLPAGSYTGNGSTGPYFINMGPVVAQDESGNPITTSGTYTTHAPFVGFLAGDGGVTLGGASTATAGQVSVGSSGATRRISNVADGIEASDAITVGQLSRLGGDATAQSQRIDRLENDLTTMSAMSVAVSALTANPRGTGAPALAIGLGHYDGVSAVAAGVVFQVASHVTYRVGFADTTHSDAQITVGGAFTW